eukprot:TRINITY_DN51170_c0_g1_i1.p1 TRINITY_DN51170_c0_g1~~TRINITY_DN51170_c0_g1_i1.p1  ORF type:complete len:141 (+),score=8.21 TRINITY_DN51170_c0_g1_i1:79-501(+)
MERNSSAVLPQRAMSASSLYRPLIIEAKPPALLQTRVDHVPDILEHYTTSINRRLGPFAPNSVASSARSSAVDGFGGPSRSTLGSTWQSMTWSGMSGMTVSPHVVKYGTVKPALSGPTSSPFFTGSVAFSSTHKSLRQHQ